MGLVQREIEDAGFSTITISNIPDLTASVSIPRLAAIETPAGRTLGNPGDRESQYDILQQTFLALEKMNTPGSLYTIDYKWQEQERPDRKDRFQPPPIAKYLVRHPWCYPRLITRDIPE